MSHVVPVIVGITIPELRNIVLTELSGDIHQLSTSASLSYWPHDTKELATGLTIPLVIITNNVAVDYSLTHLDLNKATNLFVKFASVTKIPGSSYVDDTAFTFTTPTNQINHKTNFEEGTSSTNHMNPIGNSARYASSAGFFITWFSSSTHLKVFNQMVLIFHLDMFLRSGLGYVGFSDLEDFWEVF
ncbi:hypothetical protein F2Q70_00026934 [Brassica cretica]|uniref:Uncharacterized protein n=1 Tax=Brassica cretica TaxID=69181 RepID=A0A8S9LDJ5_BRACR|nr:hypothetical protein F2Q70_00026934 [Brassica cretica]KAF3576769.1 hypothetical protein DY000_02032838 [Brassica cretica]